MRNASIDMLRAVAVLLVFGYHSEGSFVLNRFGWIGVDLFFVLSGFLVSGLLFREYQSSQAVQPGRFLIRRGLKIYPQFYFFIFAVTGISIWQNNPPSLGMIAAELTFSQNYFPGLWPHTWSLAVEEHFYLLLIFGITILANRGGQNPFRALPAWIGGVCGLVLLLRLLTWWQSEQFTDYGMIFPSHLRIDSMLTGVLVAYYHAFHPDRLGEWTHRAKDWIQPVSIALLSPASLLTRKDPFMVTIGVSLVSWGFALLLLSVLYGKTKGQAPSRMSHWMARLGQNSYAFYLWHGPVLLAGDRLKYHAEIKGIWIPSLLLTLATFGATVLLAGLATRLIESPVLRWRDRAFPANGRATRNARPGGISVPQADAA